MPYKNLEEEKAYQKRYRETHTQKRVAKEVQKIYRKRWQDKDQRRVLLNRSKYRAKKLSIEFNLTVEDIIIPKICPILLIPLVINKGQSQSNSISLDRIDNEKGYIKGNVAVISKRAN